jgi:hypothetical protein
MKRVFLFLVILALGAGAARADEVVPKASCFADPSRWAFDRSKESVAQPGQRFLADLRACDPTLAANIEEAVRHEFHQKEAQSARRNEKFVLAAYGAAWGLLALAALGVWLRWRKVKQLLAELEARVRA